METAGLLSLSRSQSAELGKFRFSVRDLTSKREGEEMTEVDIHGWSLDEACTYTPGCAIRYKHTKIKIN